MKKTLTLVTLLTIQILLATHAGAATVRYDRDKHADFATYRKVAWAQEPATGSEAIADARIRTAIEAELEKKGYALVETGEADLTVEYFAVVRERREVSETGGPLLGRNYRLRSQPEGTLIVSFQDVKSGRMVWHGAVTDGLASNPDKADKKTEKAVAKLLEDFPTR